VRDNFDSCKMDPCGNGGTCTDGDNFGYTCACTGDFASQGQTDRPACTACVAGKKPNDGKDACTNCGSHEAGADGTCAPCDDGMQPGEGNIQCVECPQETRWAWAERVTPAATAKRR
jgi:hypothetical protein